MNPKQTPPANNFRTFVTCSNNGVVAIMPWQSWKDYVADYRQMNEIVEELGRRANIEERHSVKEEARTAIAHMNAEPIFTFCNDDRFKTSPWYTGSLSLLAKLKKYLGENGGVTFNDSGIFVPFSNGAEVGIHGEDAQRSELRNVTTAGQFRDAFGISIEELEHWAAANAA